MRQVLGAAGLSMVLAVTCGAAAWLGRGEQSNAEAPAAVGPRPSRAQASPDPLEILRGWDARRSEAWADGDAATLRDLYVAGSRAGQRDVRLLRAYVRRGLRVEGLTTQVLEADVEHRAPDRLVVTLTDRTLGGTAVSAGRHGDAVRLPAGSPRRRVVVLVHGGRGWLVSVVRPVPDHG